MRTSRMILAAALVVAVITGPAVAWHGKGHELAASAAIIAAGKELPEFFTSGKAVIINCSNDPDAFTKPIAPPALHDAEASEHYFDIELLGGEPIPPTRYAFIDFCAKKGLKPSKVGLLPYAINEWTARLTVALAEYRKWPDDKAIQAKCLVYAGLLAHYAADCCQPLHVTVNYDGKVNADGNSPRSGIHNRLDALPGKAALTGEEISSGLDVKTFSDVFSAIKDQIAASGGLVDKVYKLEGQFPPMDADVAVTGEVRDFAKERMQAATGFIGSLYLTAWRDSEKIVLPP